MSALPCLPLMSSLKTIILKCILVCVFLVSPCCVHRDRRPDQTVSVVPSPRFVFFRFFTSLVCSCVLSLAASESCPPHARRSREFTPPFAALPSRGSREMTTPPSMTNPSPPARLWLNAAGPPLTQCPPACLWLNARRPASDSMPAGLLLTQARRIAADSSPPDCRWLKLGGLLLTHARWPSLAGKANLPLPQFTPPSAAHRPRRSREIRPASVGKPTHRRRLPVVRGEGQPAVRGHSARRRLWLPPARRWVVKPAGYGLASRPWPYLTRLWPRSF